MVRKWWNNLELEDKALFVLTPFTMFFTLAFLSNIVGVWVSETMFTVLLFGTIGCWSSVLSIYIADGVEPSSVANGETKK